MAIGILKQSKAFVSRVIVSEKVQEASYLVAELIARKGNESRTVGNNLIIPACKIMVGKMHYKKLKTFHFQIGR
jgi:hypothetical protein